MRRAATVDNRTNDRQSLALGQKEERICFFGMVRFVTFGCICIYIWLRVQMGGRFRMETVGLV